MTVKWQVSAFPVVHVRVIAGAARAAKCGHKVPILPPDFL